MSCKRASRDLSRYLDGELSAAARAALEAHLTRCIECRGALAAQRRLWELLGALETTEPPEVFDAIEQRLAERPRWTASLALLHARTVGLTAAFALLVLFVLAGVWAGSTWLRPAARECDQALVELLAPAPSGMEFSSLCGDGRGAP